MAPRTRKSGSGAAPGAGLDASLLARAERGDTDALQQVLDRAEEMLARAAGGRVEAGLSREDLLQEGRVAVLAAIRDFPRSGEADFEAFAERAVRRRLAEAASTELASREEAERLAADANAFDAAERVLRAELGRDAKPEEMRERLGWSADRLDEVAAAVEEARRRHDEEIVRFLEPDYFDPLEWVGRDEPKGDLQPGRDAGDGSGA